MNRCKMTFKILITLLAVLALTVPSLYAEKISDNGGPKSIHRAPGQPDMTLKNQNSHPDPWLEMKDENLQNPNSSVVAAGPEAGASVGDDCSNPISITLPLALPYSSGAITTCGHLNDYSNTCLGSYDGGEDIIFKIDVTSPTVVTITETPATTSDTWSGILVDGACPANPTTCLASITSSTSSPRVISGLALAVGTYYIMVDTWPTPNCINFSLTITAPPPPPPNDNCATATPIGDVAGQSFDCTTATQDGPGTFVTNRNVWFDYTASCNGVASVSLCATTYDTKLAIWNGNTCPPSATVATNDDGCAGPGSSLASSTSFPCVAGNHYLIEIGPYSTGTSVGTGLMSVSCAAPITNDNCASATPIGDVTNLPFNTTTASFDGPGVFITGPNIWYDYTASCNGNITVSLCGSSYDTKVRVWNGNTCPPTVEAASNDDDCGLQSRVVFGGTPGAHYLIEVGGYSASVGAGLLTTMCTLAPPRDNCVDAVPVVLTSGVPVTFTGNNQGSTNDCASFPGGQTWEAFTITQCADVTLDYCGTAGPFGDAWLNLATGCPCSAFTAAGDFNTVDCPDGNVTIKWSGLAAGTYYYPVMEDVAYLASGPYTIHVVANVPVSYCAAGSSVCDEYIGNVNVGTINNSSSCGAGGYTDYTAISTNVTQGLSYPIVVQNGFPYTSDQCGIWVDWNNDFCFSASEQLTVSGTPGGGPYSALLLAPCDAAPGPKLLRIRITYTGAVSPCGTTSYGEVEDYTLNLVAHPIVPATVLMAPDPQYAYYAHAVSPIIDEFLFGNFPGGHSAADVNMGSVQVNGLAPATVQVVPGQLGIYCDAVYATMPLATFITPYGILYDTTIAPYTVSGTFTDATPFSINGTVTLIGHRSIAPLQFIVPPQQIIIPGDFDASGGVDISDPVSMVDYIFNGGQGPNNIMVGDCDCSNAVDISDVVYMISFIFGTGPAPCQP